MRTTTIKTLTLSRETVRHLTPEDFTVGQILNSTYGQLLQAGVPEREVVAYTAQQVAQLSEPQAAYAVAVLVLDV